MDPEAELSNVMRKFTKLSGQCSVQKRAGGVPQLAPQQKQMGILRNEMQETRLCINLAKKGLHAARDRKTAQAIHMSIVEYENLLCEVIDEKGQQNEQELLNYLSRKRVTELKKQVPSEDQEIAHLEYANNSLRRMENRLDLSIKRFCTVNTENKRIRNEIDILLVERESFNVQWKRTIDKLKKGKEYLMDIFEIATQTFANRDESCRMLETLMWKGLNQLNKDIAEMQSYDSELNHLAKLEEFLRVKGSQRICEADEKEEAKRIEEEARCQEEITRHDALLNEIFEYAGTDRVRLIAEKFVQSEEETMAMFVLLCEILQETIFLKKFIEVRIQNILDQQDINSGRIIRQDKNLANLIEELMEQKQRTAIKREQALAADVTFSNLLKGFDDLARIAKCNITPLLRLLGPHLEVTKWNVRKFIKILEVEVKSIIQVVYSAVKPPPQTPKGKAQQRQPKLVQDPVVEILIPNKIEDLVPYLPCAYCVEDYMMNLVFETPAVPADKEYIEGIFHLEDVNTKFGIFTLTIPAKRHPYRNPNT